jgi:hypothetical protein
MASAPLSVAHENYWSGLADPARAIGNPRLDFLCFWGIPIICFCLTSSWVSLAGWADPAVGGSMAVGLLTLSSIITFAHLVAVAPRAYFNRDVFTSNRRRLTFVPLLLLTLLLVSPTALIIGGLVAVFWDVHHSAMQNFGLGRIYEMKAGNRPDALRTVDLRLNWVLYVGPILAGASFLTHINSLHALEKAGLHWLATLPGVIEHEHAAIRLIGIGAWAATIAWALLAYRRAHAAGYRMPAHKAALTLSTGLVSLFAWGFSSPLVAFASINLYHAIQYFALVWLKEGDRMSGHLRRSAPQALLIFLSLCALIGISYWAAPKAGLPWIMAPFIACSLLHFWYDSFVWSVTKKQV